MIVNSASSINNTSLNPQLSTAANIQDMMNSFTKLLEETNAEGNTSNLLKTIGNNLGIDLFDAKNVNFNNLLNANNINFDLNKLVSSVSMNLSVENLSKIIANPSDLNIDKLMASLNISDTIVGIQPVAQIVNNTVTGLKPVETAAAAQPIAKTTKSVNNTVTGLKAVDNTVTIQPIIRRQPVNNKVTAKPTDGIVTIQPIGTAKPVNNPVVGLRPIDGIVTIQPISVTEPINNPVAGLRLIDDLVSVQPVEQVSISDDLSKLLGVSALLGIANKFATTKESNISSKDAMNNLITQIDYSIEADKITKSLEDLKASNRVFTQYSGI